VIKEYTDVVFIYVSLNMNRLQNVFSIYLAVDSFHTVKLNYSFRRVFFIYLIHSANFLIMSTVPCSRTMLYTLLP
jgi:hypothetical protein